MKCQSKAPVSNSKPTSPPETAITPAPKRRGIRSRLSKAALRPPSFLYSIGAVSLLVLAGFTLHHAWSQDSDSDGDGMPDSWELLHSLDGGSDDSQADPDGDGVPNLAEYSAGTAPRNWDTDGNGDSDYISAYGWNLYFPEESTSSFHHSQTFPDGSKNEWMLQPGSWNYQGFTTGDGATGDWAYLEYDQNGIPAYYYTWGWNPAGTGDSGTYTYFTDRSPSGGHQENYPDGSVGDWTWGSGWMNQNLTSPDGTLSTGTYTSENGDGTHYHSAWEYSSNGSGESRSFTFNQNGTPQYSYIDYWYTDNSNQSIYTTFAPDGYPYYDSIYTYSPGAGNSSTYHYYDIDGDGRTDYDEDYLYFSDKFIPNNLAPEGFDPDTFDPTSPSGTAGQSEASYARTNADGSTEEWWWYPSSTYYYYTSADSSTYRNSNTYFDPNTGNITGFDTWASSGGGSYESTYSEYATDGSPYYTYTYSYFPDGTGDPGTYHYYDQDGDGLTDYDEDYTFFTLKEHKDTDLDGVDDGDEVAIFLANPAYPDDYANQDTDGDGMNDLWEYQNYLYPITHDPTSDTDTDLLVNLGEYLFGLDPNLPDTDADGISDYDEVYGPDAEQWIIDQDTDGDNIPDRDELRMGLNPHNPADAGEVSVGDAGGRTYLQVYQDETNGNQTQPDGTPYVDPPSALQFRGKILFWDYSNSTNSSDLRAANYSNTDSSVAQTGSPLTSADKAATFAEVDLGDWVSESSTVDHLVDDERGSGFLSASGDGQIGSKSYVAEATEMRLVTDEPPLQPITRSYVKTTYANGGPDSWEPEQIVSSEVVYLTIPAVPDAENPGQGPWVSDGIIELKPAFVEGEYFRISADPLETELLVAVDSDRNGEIEFDKDFTTAEFPYTFWVNHDRDVGRRVDDEDWEEDDVLGGEYPPADDISEPGLTSRRDLEDLTRIWIDLSDADHLNNHDANLSLHARMERTSGTRTPQITLFKPVELDGGRMYLFDNDTGYNQVDDWPYNEELCTVTNTPEGVEIPRSAWETLGDKKTVHFLFEGKWQGNGKLIFEFRRFGKVIVRLPPVYINLLSVDSMYETWTVLIRQLNARRNRCCVSAVF